MKISVNDPVQQKDTSGFIHSGVVIELKIGRNNKAEARIRWHGGFSTWEPVETLTVTGRATQ